MRRGLAAIILGVSLVLASVSWAGFTMLRTTLNPDRSEKMADLLLDDEAVREAVVDRLGSSLQEALPAGTQVSNETLEAAADAALDSPEVESFIKDGVVQAHQNALEGNDEPIEIDVSQVASALRSSLIEAEPELASSIPEITETPLELPTKGLSAVGTVRKLVKRFTPIGAGVALLGIITALIITTKRSKVLRSVSYWAFGVAIFWLVIGFGVPKLADVLASSSLALVAAVVKVFVGAMIGPALIMLAIGAVLFVASILLPKWSLNKNLDAISSGAVAQTPKAKPYTASMAQKAPSSVPMQTGPSPSPTQHAAATSQHFQSEAMGDTQTASQPQALEAMAAEPRIYQNKGQRPLPEKVPSAEAEEKVWEAGKGYLDEPQRGPNLFDEDDL